MKVNEMVKSERLQNLTHGLETCCLGAKQLVLKCQCYPVQSEHEGQGNQFSLGDLEECCWRETQDTTWGGRVGQQWSTMFSTKQCYSQIGLGEDVHWRKSWNGLGCRDMQGWRKSRTSSQGRAIGDVWVPTRNMWSSDSDFNWLTFPSTDMKMSYTIIGFLATTLWSKTKHWW